MCPALSVTRTVREWNISVGIDYKTILTALVHAVLAAKTGQPKDALLKLLDGIKISSGLGPNELAWLLISRAAIRTMRQVLAAGMPGVLQRTEQQIVEICEETANAIESNLLSIGPEFFERPSDHPLIAPLVSLLAEWEKRLLLVSPTGSSMLFRFRVNFAANLHEEWIANSEKYEKINAAFKSPFIDAIGREEAWARYVKWLWSDFERAQTDDGAGFNQLYVPLRGVIPASTSHEKEYIVELDDELDQWLQTESASKLRVISGDVGSGKSSAAKFFTCRANRDSFYRSVFVPLENLEYVKNLQQSFNSWAQSQGFFVHEPLHPVAGDGKLLVILDGLDDLPMASIGPFFKDATTLVETYNRFSEKLRLVLTARPATVKVLPSRYRSTRELITLLPHFVGPEEREKFSDPNDLLAEDRRLRWLSQYTKVTGKDLEGLRKMFENGEAASLGAHPMELHLLAMAHGRPSFSPSEQVQLSDLYGELLKNTYDRDWGRFTGRKPRLTLSEFEELFQEVAWAIWQESPIPTPLSKLRGAILGVNLGHSQAWLQDDDELVRVLSSFYVKENTSVTERERTFGFTHSTSRSYLVVRKIVRELRAMVRESSAREEIDQNDIGNQIDRWVQVCGRARLTDDHLQFLRDELSHEAPDILAEYQSVSLKILQNCIERKYKIPNALSDLPLGEMQRRLRNTEELILALVCTIAGIRKKPFRPVFQDESALGRWIGEVVGQRRQGEQSIALRCLSWIAAVEFRITAQDLLGAQLQYSVLSGVQLRWSCLRYSDVSYAKLDNGADLRGCDCQSAEMRGVDLTGALLQGADLRWANLEGAILENCDCEGADFRGAQMRGTRCKGTSFTDADLRELACEYEEIINLDWTGARIDNAPE